jgi:hypothetical protein
VINMAGRPAGITGIEMPPEGRRATGHHGSPDFARTTWQVMGGKIGRTEGGEHLGQAAPIHGRRSVGNEQFER